MASLLVLLQPAAVTHESLDTLMLRWKPVELTFRTIIEMQMCVYWLLSELLQGIFFFPFKWFGEKVLFLSTVVFFSDNYRKVKLVAVFLIFPSLLLSFPSIKMLILS